MPPPRPHPLTRSPNIDRANHWLEKAWRKGIANRPSLDPVVLWEKALRDAPRHGEAGPRSEADIADFRARTIAITQSLESEAQLNSLGRTIAHGQLVRVIRQRLDLGALWQKRPETLQHDIAPPIIVVGQMRSGTTRIHRLLAADPGIASTRFCDSWLPVPRRPDTRPAWSALSLLFARTLDPWLDSIHPFGVTRPDEELGWLACALDHCAYEAQWRIPGFSAFSENRHPAPVYREFARILRTDAHFHGNADKPRVLKVPQFAEDLPALLAQFPDARLVITHRCIEDITASAGSLVANQMAIQSDTPCIAWIGEEVRRKITLRQQRMDTARAEFSGPVVNVDFEALNGDWEAVIRQTYAQLDMELTDKAVLAMRKEQARALHSPHTQHEYCAKTAKASAPSAV